ncbi:MULTISPECIES: histidine phosphatase family protein [unclassified Streptomyces]|uniref:SixA phosphatase family protein n=1 Tax=unclassified Streptomyces TaxID=2593676 RepID=UPI00225155C4|nr:MULTISPECIES: histidine phosphatase family protein [unclassified Streptomyces]MCX5013011.1 histidine phosphatase family protein [Streptomyces sp. NBC_00555]MCX5606983.1 histidine phosphatase family protein [Streptomyces sp. NBC_00047]
MTAGTFRRLVVLRHAKSAWPPDVPDAERPLGPRGLRDAPAAGRWLREGDCEPDLVVCSPARRTRQTWDLAAAESGVSAPVTYEERVYGASTEELLDLVRETPAQVRTLLLVGHNPGAQELVLSLAGEGDARGLEQARTKFPTSAIAVLRVPGSWSSLVPGAARLTDLVVPRGAKP